MGHRIVAWDLVSDRNGDYILSNNLQNGARVQRREGGLLNSNRSAESWLIFASGAVRLTLAAA